MFNGILSFFKMCWKYNKKYIFLLILNQVLKVVLALIALYLPQLVLDSLFTQHNYDKAVTYIIFLLISSFLFGAISSLIYRILNDQRMKTFHCFQIDLGQYMMLTKLENIETEDFLDLKAKAEQYLYGGGNGFASVLEGSIDILGGVLTLLVYSTIISQLSPGVLILLILLLLINTIFNYYFQKKNIAINLEKATQERKSYYYSDIFQNFSYGKEIRVNNLKDWLIKKYDNQLMKMQGFYSSINKNNFIYSFITLALSILQQAVSYFYLIMEVLKGRLSVGVFSLYLNAIVAFNNTIKSLISQFITLHQYTDYYQAYKEYISIANPNTVDEKYKDDKVYSSLKYNFTIEFKNVSFRYPKNEHNSLSNINVIIQKGDRIAIVGKNGAGKSTFVKLLLRIYKPTDGTITINGINIWEISYKQYSKLFATVFQDYKLFAQSIKENIAFDSKADSSKIIEILMQLGMNDKVKALPHGLDTNLYKMFDNAGYIPSEGEAQKIAISRAIYKNAPIMILDEPSSSLDPQSEFNIYSIFSDMTKTKTCVFVSHRLSISTICNKILVFEQGTISENGTHDTLIKQNGIYSSMYMKQLAYYDCEALKKVDSVVLEDANFFN